MRNMFLCLMALLFISCWVPPYNSDASNSIYLMKSMNFYGSVNLNETSQWIYTDTYGENLFFGRTQLKPSLTGERAYLSSYEGIAWLQKEGDQWKLNGYFNETDFVSEAPILRFNDTMNNSGTSTTYSNGNLIIRPYEDSNEATLDSIFIMARPWSDSANPYSFSQSLYTINSQDLYHWTSGLSLQSELNFISGTMYTDSNSESTHLLALMTELDYETNQLIPGLYQMEFQPTALSPALLLNLEGILPEFFSLENCRISYDEINHICIITDLSNEIYQNYWLNTQNPGTLEPWFNPIESIDSSSYVLTSLENGYFLFQGYYGDNHFFLTLWKPGSKPSKLEMGKLFYVDHYEVNGEKQLIFNYIQNYYDNDQELRNLFLYTISDQKIISMFN